MNADLVEEFFDAINAKDTAKVRCMLSRSSTLVDESYGQVNVGQS
jgi:hypothetical protein